MYTTDTYIPLTHIYHWHMQHSVQSELYSMLGYDTLLILRLCWWIYLFCAHRLSKMERSTSAGSRPTPASAPMRGWVASMSARALSMNLYHIIVYIYYMDITQWCDVFSYELKLTWTRSSLMCTRCISGRCASQYHSKVPGPVISELITQVDAEWAHFTRPPWQQPWGSTGPPVCTI